MFDDDVERYPDPKGAEAEFYSRYQRAKAERILMEEAGESVDSRLSWVDTIRGVPSVCVELKQDVVISLSYPDQAGVCRWTLFEKSKGTEPAFKEVCRCEITREELKELIRKQLTQLAHKDNQQSA